MMERKVWWTALAGALFLISGPLWGAEISVEGGPMETGFNSGTFAYIHATVHGLTGQAKRYVVFAEIQYYGTTSNTSVEMDRLPMAGEALDLLAPKAAAEKARAIYLYDVTSVYFEGLENELAEQRSYFRNGGRDQ